MSFEKFCTTTVFRENIKAYNAKCDMIINQGGSRSGKTVAILQVLFLVALASKIPLIISVVSRALPHLRLGAMRDFDNIIDSYGMSLNCKNRTENTYRIGKSIVEFFGADQIDKVHGPSRDILFINEANFVKYEIFDMLNIRTNGTVFIDFNPTRRFWAHDYVGKKDVVFLKSTYKDNELIPQKILERIEAKKGNAAWWRVYGEGEIGIAEGAIYNNWSYIEDDEFPVGGYGFGLDYGFYPDPDALIKVAIDDRDKKIFCHECIYDNFNGTEDLKAKMHDYCLTRDLIIAESATPRTNYDLRKIFFNLKPVSKTKTVVEWIREIQNYQIIITKSSYNLELELSNYVWSDKKAGIPMDGFDHGLDAMRYFFMYKMKKIRRNW
jgi:phage terminase large subunit